MTLYAVALEDDYVFRIEFVHAETPEEATVEAESLYETSNAVWRSVAPVPDET